MASYVKILQLRSEKPGTQTKAQSQAKAEAQRAAKAQAQAKHASEKPSYPQQYTLLNWRASS